MATDDGAEAPNCTPNHSGNISEDRVRFPTTITTLTRTAEGSQAMPAIARESASDTVTGVGVGMGAGIGTGEGVGVSTTSINNSPSMAVSTHAGNSAQESTGETVVRTSDTHVMHSGTTTVESSGTTVQSKRATGRAFLQPWRSMVVPLSSSSAPKSEPNSVTGNLRLGGDTGSVSCSDEYGKETSQQDVFRFFATIEISDSAAHAVNIIAADDSSPFSGAKVMQGGKQDRIPFDDDIPPNKRACSVERPFCAPVSLGAGANGGGGDEIEAVDAHVSGPTTILPSYGADSEQFIVTIQMTKHNEDESFARFEFRRFGHNYSTFAVVHDTAFTSQLHKF